VYRLRTDDGSPAMTGHSDCGRKVMFFIRSMIFACMEKLVMIVFFSRIAREQW
jgi:hypothetical protein